MIYLNYKNIKNQKVYKVLYSCATNVSDTNNEKYMVVYMDSDRKVFVRDRMEFYAKFEKVE